MGIMDGRREKFLRKKLIQELSTFNESYLSELSDTALNKSLHLAYEVRISCKSP